ncbi:unnamed protein product [Kuraishia capsulata CBS 1993]|uniref:Formate/nitrite transporter n=1 Tax=Kuraishia capsulata CBS 1993 TaxID=1382522 RepID=W6MQF6_9ASCO|nr:uncharacterized protein KUCA_T00004906001 [Kuraishia capsulata CBS 1993]CDK28921.1 unnamed protein product [Kuraishia capsulata CBS 1993]
MVDDSYYITTHEAALAVVATAMKKSRLRLDTLIINSIMGGILFSVGGMLHIMVQAQNPGLIASDQLGIVQLLQGLVYGLGLFNVVIMGVDLFNSNILFFSVGLMRGAVTIVDLLISWFVSFFFNLASTIMVVALVMHASGVASTDNYIQGSIDIIVEKAEFSFAQTFVKGIACNFCVALAIYLQLMVKPLHVKLLMIILPVFTFVSMGFNHVVADMFLCPVGLFNNAPVSVATYIWKIMIPAALGNIVGGAFFGITIPWYLHLVVIEMDQKRLNLPQWDQRDEQPELNMDSRVVRVPIRQEKDQLESPNSDSTSSFSQEGRNDNDPVQMFAENNRNSLERANTSSTMRSTTQSTNRKVRSPKGVFPVYGMGEPLEREKSIATGEVDPNFDDIIDDEIAAEANTEANADIPNSYNPDKDTLGGVLRQTLSRVTTRQARTNSDLESAGAPSFKRHFSFGGGRNSDDISKRLADARITHRAAKWSDDVAGIANDSILQPRVIKFDEQKQQQQQQQQQEQQSHRASRSETVRSVSVTQESAHNQQLRLDQASEVSIDSSASDAEEEEGVSQEAGERKDSS